MKKIFALGFFDGVHLGHQKILAECCRLAEKLDAKACAVTFLQHPRSLFIKTPPPLINTYADRLLLLRKYGIGPVFSYPVTRKIMGMPWGTFLEELISYDAVGFVCGRDFRFGNRGEGDSEKLKTFCEERGLAFRVVENQTLDGIRISSTHIRTLLEGGNLVQANRFLGHPHVLSGEVVSGQQLGRTIGIPTANLLFPADLLIPKFGVYACKVTTDSREYLAVTNIGTRPTVGGNCVTAEAFLLDFSGDLYGKTLQIAFCKFLRPEKKFSNLEELKEEILKNVRQTREFFEKSE